MAGAVYSYEQLLEKLVRAKVKLEGARRSHSDRCMVEVDPEYHGPCTCGASGSNSAVNEALRELKL